MSEAESQPVLLDVPPDPQAVAALKARCAALELETIRLLGLVEGQIRYWEREASDASDGGSRDYYQAEADELRMSLAQDAGHEVREMYERLTAASALVQAAEYKQHEAERRLRGCRELHAFADWLKRSFPGVFDLQRLTGFHDRQQQIERALRDCVRHLPDDNWARKEAEKALALPDRFRAEEPAPNEGGEAPTQPWDDVYAAALRDQALQAREDEHGARGGG